MTSGVKCPRRQFDILIIYMTMRDTSQQVRPPGAQKQSVAGELFSPFGSRLAGGRYVDLDNVRLWFAHFY